MTERSVSVVIPVLNAAPYLPALFEALAGQEPAAPSEVVLVDSNSSDDTRAVAARHARVRVLPIERFSHGGARNLGARAASGDLVVLMTQDALPRDARWLARLLEPFEDPSVAAAYSRQVPRPDASPMERYFLHTHFPPGERRRQSGGGPGPLTLERVFFSNVSAAARRPLLLEHPFDEGLIMSEDQQFSRDLMNAGHAVVYVPDSVVIHSHGYTLGTVFKRYLDSVYSLTLIFPRHGMGTSASMGLRYLGREFAFVAWRHPGTLPYYALYTLAKVGGTLTGHLAPHLPRAWLRHLSLHRYHWEGRSDHSPGL